jgi:hypothetical protein
MVENVGLGSAIAEGTDLRGNFGSPITQGLQLNQRNVIADAAREQAKLAKQQAMMEKMAKYTTFDEGVWADKKLAEEAKNVIKEGTAKIMLSMQSGDRIGAEQSKMETQNKLGSLKLLNQDYVKLKKLSPKNANTKRVLETFSKGGVGAIQQNDQKFFFAPDLIVNEDGSFEPVEYQDIKAKSTLNKIANSVLDQVVPNTKPVVVDGRAYRSVDKNSPEYVAAKQRTFEIFNDYKKDVLGSDEFRDFYSKYLKENKIPEDAVRVEPEIDISGNELPPDYEAAYQKWVSDNFDKIVTPPVTSTKLAQGKGREPSSAYNTEGSFTYRFFNGRTSVRKPKSEVTKRTYKGFLANEANGLFDSVKEDISIENPDFEYVPNGDYFLMAGKGEYGDYIKAKITPEELMISEGIKDKQKLAKLFPDYKPKQAASGAGKPKESNKPKDSFPVWKSKNPNGTAAQYKQYKNS